MVSTDAEPFLPPAAAPPSSASKKRKTQLDEIEVDLSLPEPPSKKAKRLLKKGKPLPVKPASDDEADDGLEIPKKDTKEKKRSEYGIWIGNLPFTLTRPELFKWLIECSGGAIKEDNITRVNLPTNKERNKHIRQQDGEGTQNKPQNKGFAYIDFDAEAVAVAAMALTETELDGRKVLIKNATSFEGRPQKEPSTATAENGAKEGIDSAPAATPKNASRKIYVGNLSFQVTEDDLRAQFDKCGEIDWVKVATFEDSGKCKGYGWVKFREADAANWAVKGFVKVKEEIETEDDFRDDNDDDDENKEKQKKFQMRKWWVNRLHGRELKIELAEDDQVRYKKRYKSGGANRDGGRPDKKEGGGNKDNAAFKKTASDRTKYGDSSVVSYKTGAVLKPEGKKVTFN